MCIEVVYVHRVYKWLDMCIVYMAGCPPKQKAKNDAHQQLCSQQHSSIIQDQTMPCSIVYATSTLRYMLWSAIARGKRASHVGKRWQKKKIERKWVYILHHMYSARMWHSLKHLLWTQEYWFFLQEFPSRESSPKVRCHSSPWKRAYHKAAPSDRGDSKAGNFWVMCNSTSRLPLHSCSHHPGWKSR